MSDPGRPGPSFPVCLAVQSAMVAAVSAVGFHFNVFTNPPESGWPFFIVLMSVIAVVAALSQWRAGRR